MKTATRGELMGPKVKRGTYLALDLQVEHWFSGHTDVCILLKCPRHSLWNLGTPAWMSVYLP